MKINKLQSGRLDESASHSVPQGKTEAKIQSDIVKWFWNFKPQYRGQLFMVQNTSENAKKGAINMSMGLLSGVSDLCLIWYSKIIFIEIKTDTGKQSKKQSEFQYTCEKLNHKYIIIRSIKEFQNLICELEK